MTTCSACGHANGPGAAFCGSCSGYLAWGSQDPAATRVPATQAAAPSGGDPVSSQVIPTARPPEAEEPKLAPLPVTDPSPTDLFCGSCGAGNADGRRYCRRCGGELEDVMRTQGPAPRWWRQLWAWLRSHLWGRGRAPLTAGARPDSWAQTPAPGRRRRRLRMPTRLSLGKLAMPLCVLSLFGLGLGPLRVQVTDKVYGAYHSVQRRIAPDYVNVTAQGAKASTSVRGHRATQAIDQNTGTWWAAEPTDVPRAGVHLDVRYDQPVDVVRVAFHNGAQGREFAQLPRVRSARLVFSGPGAVTVTKDLELEDTPQLQSFSVKAEDVRLVVLHVLSVYPGQRSGSTALSEFQLVKVK